MTRSSGAPRWVGIFPSKAAITRLVGAIQLEQNDEWLVQRARYMILETIAPLHDDLTCMDASRFARLSEASGRTVLDAAMHPASG